MRKLWIKLNILLLGGVTLVGVLLVLSVNSQEARSARSDGAATVALNAATASNSTDKYDRHGLGTAPLDQVRRYMEDYVVRNHEVRSGTPQLLLARFVTRNDVSSLNLGCLAESITIEDPPLALAVFKGDFGGGRMDMPAHYVAYVFDLWAGMPTYTITSIDGRGFKKVLNDPSLPDGAYDTAYVCPTPGSTMKEKFHYGDTVPGFTEPPKLPSDIATSVALQALTPTVLPTTTSILPPPVETVISTIVPPSIPTTGIR